LAIVLAPAGAGFLGLGAGLKATAASGLATGFISATASTIIGGIGASLVLGGIAQLISPHKLIQVQNVARKQHDLNRLRSQALPILRSKDCQSQFVTVVHTLVRL
jgi:predicted phage tail protein